MEEDKIPPFAELYEGTGPRDQCRTGESQKIIKNCPCAGCGFQMERIIEEASQSTEEPEEEAEEETEETERAIRFNSFVLRLLIIGVLSVGAITALIQQIRARAAAARNTVPEWRTSAELFEATDFAPDIERSQIPSALPGYLEGLGRVHSSPEDYDPNKPNLYLIANKHFSSEKGSIGYEKGGFKKRLYQTQETVLKISHILFGLGVRRQFLEGVPRGFQMKHDETRSRGLAEFPHRAMPVYRRTGQIHRSYVAVEGVYGNEMESVGAEDQETWLRLEAEARRAMNEVFPRMIISIVPAIAQDLGIPFNTPPRWTPRTITALSSRIRERTRTLSPEQVQDLVVRLVQTNPDFSTYVNARARYSHDFISGRNERYASEIASPTAEGRKDAQFIVGALHVEGIRESVKDHNVFIIQPKEVDDEELVSPDQGVTLDEFEEKMAKGCLYSFGLREEKPS